jgi:hypothetical protein
MMKSDSGIKQTGLSFWRAGIFVLVGLLCSCSAKVPERVYATPQALEVGLRGDARTLSGLRPQLAELDSEFKTLQDTGGWRETGYLSVDETDRMSELLFRFRAAHSALWDITAAYGNMRHPFVDPALDAKASILGREASLLLASHSAYVVAIFGRDPVAVDKLNEAFFRLSIPRDSFYQLSRSIDSNRLSRVRRADALVAQERLDPNSALSHLVRADSSYAERLEQTETLQHVAEARLVAALEARGIDVPEPVHLADEAVERGLYVARSILFKDVSRLKSPSAHLVKFSESQKAEVYSKLEPGDLILTYTAGYTSDIFIPGAFKHGITFVGSPEQRSDAGVAHASLDGIVPDRHDRLASHLTQANLEGGEPADVIEAVAEGVIFNHLAHIMDTHINRLLVLRPKLNDKERAEFLVSVFSYLGEEYDFRFDFADSTRQVCTEVIYRAIQGKGGIEFDLTVRAGHETLSADDISLYFLEKKPAAFEFVLYAEEDPNRSDHAAIILTGDAGLERLEGLMKSVSE